MTVDDHLSTARTLAKLLDAQFRVAGFSFGLDPLFDILPGIGTLLPTFLSLYILWIGNELHLPTPVLVRMVWNILLDGVIGSIPIVGVFFDAVYKGNLANITLIEEAQKQRETPVQKIVL